MNAMSPSKSNEVKLIQEKLYNLFLLYAITETRSVG